MPVLNSVLSFALVVLLIGLTPGPALVYICSQSMAGGVRSGLAGALGTHLGSYLHIAVAASGAGLLLEAAPGLYHAVRFAGAAYLVHVGLRLVLGGPAGEPGAGARTDLRADPTVRQALVVELLNPQSALFYLSFLPQFAEPSSAVPMVVQMILLGAAANVLMLVIECGVAAAAARMTARMRLRPRPGGVDLARRAGGSLIAVLGLCLALGLV